MPEKPSWRNAWPFIVALVVAVVVVVIVILSNVIRPADDRASDSGQVQLVINRAYTARNSLDYGAYRKALCSSQLSSAEFPSEKAFVDDATKSREVNGRYVIPEITDIKVSGDNATANVHGHFEKHADNQQTTAVSLVRENGDWKVCSSI